MSHSPATVETPLTAEHLPDDPATLKCMILELLQAMPQRDRDSAAMQHRLEMLLRRLYGPKGERFDPNQCLLFPDAAADQPSASAPPEQPDAQEKPKRKCRPHGRRRLPEHLPRVPRHHELTLAERICSSCGQLREEIGIDTSEQLDYKPASLFVIEHIVHKYACPCCSKTRQQALPPLPSVSVMPQSTPSSEAPSSSLAATGVTGEQEVMTTPSEPSLPQHQPAEQDAAAPMCPTTTPPTTTSPAAVVIAAARPAMPIAKGLAGPGLLAHLIVSKYEDHLPLYRLENIYERQGLFLPRSTLCDWLLACGQLLRPLYDRLVYHTLLSRALHTDDTPVKLQDPKTHLLSTARMWAYLGDAAHPYNVFDFTLNRRRDGPQQFLSGYQGYLHADAFGGYDRLYLPDPLTTQAGIIEVACNAHARRKFYEAQSSDLLRSTQALAYYRQLYELERQARDFDEFQRLRMRQELSLPILEKFRAWIDKEHAEVLPRSPVAEALGYARNNWTALVRYTEAGYLAIDNNVAEREMKRIAIGRKNWLFIGSRQGGEMAAVMMSMTSTCKRLGAEPWAYLNDVLTRLPATPVEGLDALLPDRWKAQQRDRPPTTPPKQSGGGGASPA
jgi:transposase